jgi:CHASE2 domain-containing sensor protein
MQQLLRATWTDVELKGFRYWLLASAFIAAGIAASGYLNSHYLFLGLRYTAYQMLQRTGPRDTQHARSVVFVAIDDAEFWRGRLDRRIPVKRDYLASLVEILDAADPEVVAIDYALRSPAPDGSLVETPAYAGETAKLIAAIERTTNCTVVLPATLNQSSYDERTQAYALDSSIFGSHRFLNPRVRWGYVNVFPDIRRIPLAVRIQGSRLLVPSFSQQIAATLDPQSETAWHSQGRVFGSFMPIAGFAAIPARLVLSDPAGSWRDRVRHRAIIIGSFAHRDAEDRGPYIDGFPTPAGVVPGAAVHANYVEALVNGRIYPVIPAVASDTAEILLSLAVSITLARRLGVLRKAAYFVSLLASAFVLSYFLLQNLAAFFDPALPVLAVIFHSLGERAFGPQHAPVLHT